MSTKESRSISVRSGCCGQNGRSNGAANTSWTKESILSGLRRSKKRLRLKLREKEAEGPIGPDPWPLAGKRPLAGKPIASPRREERGRPADRLTDSQSPLLLLLLLLLL